MSHCPICQAEEAMWEAREKSMKPGITGEPNEADRRRSAIEWIREFEKRVRETERARLFREAGEFNGVNDAIWNEAVEACARVVEEKGGGMFPRYPATGFDIRRLKRGRP